MKCPECGHNQKAKMGLRCLECSYEYAFDPKQPPKMTDGRFKAIVRRASANDTRYFTLNQLYAAYLGFHRKSMKSSLGCAGVAAAISLLLGIIGFAVGNPEISWFGAIPAVVAVLVVLGYFFGGKPPFPSPEEFDAKAVARWEGKRGKLPKLLRQPSLHRPPEDQRFEDIYEHGVERLLIVQRDILVDLFVRNGWHAEQRALVIAESGYPAHLTEYARNLLKERPDLPVFLLHDASPEGADMAKRLARSGLLPLGDHEVSDLGLFSEDAKKFKRLNHFGGKGKDNEAPVDALPFGTLAVGAAAAVVGGMVFADLLRPEAQERWASTSGAGGTFDFG